MSVAPRMPAPLRHSLGAPKERAGAPAARVLDSTHSMSAPLVTFCCTKITIACGEAPHRRGVTEAKSNKFMIFDTGALFAHLKQLRRIHMKSAIIAIAALLVGGTASAQQDYAQPYDSQDLAPATAQPTDEPPP